jgi:outer membrane protein OmpA-like peptidoglycan-associated protein
MFAYSQSAHSQFENDSIKRAKLLNEARIKAANNAVEINIRNVDITKFPEVSVIVEAYNIYGLPVDTLYSKSITVMENGVEKEIISVQKISVKERVPVDFIFIIDKTGSMQKYIDQVKSNIYNFTTSLVKRGIDYKLGLVLFSDSVDVVKQPTADVTQFLSWLEPVRSGGGADEAENALEALKVSLNKMDYRPSANKVGVIITDAPYHQEGQNGNGITTETTASITKLMSRKEFRLFSIVPLRLAEYKQMSQATKGNVYDIDYAFSTILDNFSNQLTNLYAIKYRTDKPAIPDSIDIALLNEKKKELTRKTIPIVELGRKLIIENLLFDVNSSSLPDSVRELEILHMFMTNKPNVVIMVEGHADGKGKDRENDKISLNRAESVKNYLLKRGIKAYRIKTKGYGKRKPIADNTTEFGRRLNRRTEIIIVGK